MASSIAGAAARRMASLAASSSSSSSSKLCAAGTRTLHTTGAKQSAYDYDYMHAEHMYNLGAMKHRKLKMGVAVFSVVAIGTLVPIGAVIFQQKKAGLM